MPHGLACSFTIPAIWAEITETEKMKLKHKLLIQQAVEVIEAFNLKTRISRWINLEDAFNLIEGMLSSNRAQNFVQEPNEKMLRNILISSL